ncbi:alpha/beta hydrolase [Streptomyces sp. NPDC094448]|uniref:alpha/beta hydrolase n=1 Tax=Streptomyces sp. NPDC094448 TaxID=3366063 RepID=UPI003811F8DE
MHIGHIGHGRFRASALTAAALLLAGTVFGCTKDGSAGGGPGERAGTAAGGGSGSTAPSAAPSAPASPPSDPGRAPVTTAALPAALTGQKLGWSACKAPVKADGMYAEKPGARWQCATLKAPLDYTEPDGETLGIALIRSVAKDSRKRIGSLLFNFGGPGGSGVAALPGGDDIVKKLGGAYDLVSFDPRGVAESSAVVCRDDKAIAASHRVDSTPDGPAEQRAFMAASAGFGADCARRSGKVLPHVGTANTARDMDLMRQVLGDTKLHYLGFSYGTELGGVYAHLFPEKVGRLAMDGVVDPTADLARGTRNQAVGFQRALENYYKSRGIGAAEGTARTVQLLKRLDARPIPAGDRRTLTEHMARTGIIQSLYSEQYWPYLTDALKAAGKGDGSELLALADMYTGRDEKGRYSTQDHAQRAISCADSASRPTAAEVTSRHLADFTAVSPVFGPYLAWDVAGWCADWPVDGAWEKPPVSAKGAAPILVVGTTGDPATPVEGAKKMADGLGTGVGVLVTSEGENHGSYGFSKCATRLVDDYLLKGTVPRSGTVCSA